MTRKKKACGEQGSFMESENPGDKLWEETTFLQEKGSG